MEKQTGADPGSGMAVRVAAIYALFSLGYILLSDRILLFFVSDTRLLTWVQTYKGIGFILVTAVLIFWMIRRETRQLQRMRSQLQQSEEKYRVVVDNSPDLMYRTDLEGRIVFISPSVRRMTGFSVSDALGLDLAREVYANPEDREALLEQLGRDGYVKNFEARLKKKDGSFWWASTNAHFYCDGRGEILGVEGVTRDVTRKKESEQAILTSEQQLRAIFEANPDPMVVYDLSGFPIRLNPAFTEVFGWTFEELKGRRIPFVPEEEQALSAGKIREIFATGLPLSFETRRLTRDGRILDIILSAAVIKDAAGVPYGMVVNLTDISEKKLLEVQYEQAQKMESLGTLAGGIAHDFNNFLTGILGYIDLAAKKTENERAKTLLHKALDATDRARSLTHQLLTFSKGGAPVKEVAPLDAMLRETVHFALSGANVSCEFDISDGLWTCEYDRHQICQVIDNIVINAKHAMPDGGRIHIAAENIEGQKFPGAGLPGGQYVKISVRDSGTGIPSKHITRVFDPFFSTKQEGSGLGLATSYSIVRRHGGTITVESEPGQGARFDVYLPATGETGTEAGKSPEEDFRGSGTILIMDDDGAIRDMLRQMLEGMGFAVIEASNGEEALSAFSRQKPIAAILDLTVPGGMGGKGTVRRIRETDRSTPVFVASGYSDDEALASPAAFGFTASLEKPFLNKHLKQMLRQHLAPAPGEA